METLDILKILNDFRIFMTSTTVGKLIISLIVLYILFILTKKLNVFRIKYKIRHNIKGLANNSLELSTKKFFKMRNKSFGGQGNPLYVNEHKFSGVYILYNKSKNMYYVGQAQNTLNRVNSHLTGSGNGDVYADFKYGDTFTIKMIDLNYTDYKSLNELERIMINYHNAYKKGYNKNSGNRN